MMRLMRLFFNEAIRPDELTFLATALFLTSPARDFPLALPWPLLLSQSAFVFPLVFALALPALVFRWLLRDGPFGPARGSAVLLIRFERFDRDPQVAAPLLASQHFFVEQQPDVRWSDAEEPGGFRRRHYCIRDFDHTLRRYTCAYIFVKPVLKRLTPSPCARACVLRIEGLVVMPFMILIT